jgi:hypothetical protein
MQFETIAYDDLNEIKLLQPEGWSDIIPDIGYYIRSEFCNPMKVIIDNVIIGIGVSIIYGTTAWLAHIIVDSGFRNKGIGHQIVQELLKGIKNTPVETCLLTATELGKPVYIKAGFRTIAEYVFMNREKPWQEQSISVNIIDFQEKFREQILQIDKLVSAENREQLLADFISGAKVYTMGDAVLGYFIPGLKEGPIIAETPEAGLELMKIKCQTAERIVLPANNHICIDFLKQNGFAETPTKGTRMLIGKDLIWKPEKIYSRIGGNFG